MKDTLPSAHLCPRWGAIKTMADFFMKSAILLFNCILSSGIGSNNASIDSWLSGERIPRHHVKTSSCSEAVVSKVDKTATASANTFQRLVICSSFSG